MVPSACVLACDCSKCWGSADYLFYFLKSSNIPVPIATTGQAAVLGMSKTDHGYFNGTQLTLGMWVNEERTSGVQVSAFVLENLVERATVFGGGGVLARPFFDTAITAPNARVLSLPGAFAGSISTANETRFWGGEFDFVGRLVKDDATAIDGLTLDALFGFRFLSLEESYTIWDTATVLPAGVTAFNGTGVAAFGNTSATDRFATQNRFYGGTIGLQAGYATDRVTIGVTAKVSLGNVYESVGRSGTTTLSAGGPPLAATVPGGLYNLGSNIGRETNNEFAAVPEVNLRIGLRANSCVSLTAGYNFLYMSRVVRPGDQITQTVNPTLIPTSPTLGVPFGPRLPAPTVTPSDFWAHGLNVGVSFTY